MKNLYEAIQPLREKYPHLCLSEAVVACLDHNERLEKYCKELREENENCKAQYQHWDKKYSEALIRMREMKKEIERLKTENKLYKSSMNHYKGITLKIKRERERVINRNIEILSILHTISPEAWEQVIKTVSEKHKTECICDITQLVTEEE